MMSVSIVCSWWCSVANLCPTLQDIRDCSMPGFPVLHYLLEFAQIYVHWVGDAIQPSHPLFPPSPPALNLSQNQNLFQWLSSCIRCAKYWNFSFTISPSNEYSRLISIRINWLDLLAVQGTLKSLFQHHNLKATVLQRSVFFMVQLLDPYMTTGKSIALTRQIIISKVMSLLLNMLSKFAIGLLSRSKCLLISWLQSLSAVILEPKKINLSLFLLFPHLSALKW